jgi:hypothetical protein
VLRLIFPPSKAWGDKTKLSTPKVDPGQLRPIPWIIAGMFVTVGPMLKADGSQSSVLIYNSLPRCTEKAVHAGYFLPVLFSDSVKY